MSVATHAPSADRLNGSAPTVTLGGKQYLVIPQPIGRLKRRLGRSLGDLSELGFDSLENFVVDGMERAHSVLSVFIPELMPLYEFAGYTSQEAYEKDEGEPTGPTIPEIVDAFEAVMKVNRLDLLGHLKQLVPMPMLRAALTSVLAEAMTNGQMTTWPSTSATPGLDTRSTISGTTVPTSTSSGD